MTVVLLIDDDRELAELLSDYLGEEGLEVFHIADGRKALGSIIEVRADIVVLDIMMPAVSGVEVLRRIRRESDIPVLMLTARGDEVDRISGLDLGADDYLAKPCSPGELAARIRAILRRTTKERPAAGEPMIRLGALELHSAKRSASWAGTPLALTAAEFALLEALASRPAEVLSRNELSELALGRPLAAYDRAIDVHISAIRTKMAALGTSGPLIQSVRGQGYQLVLP